MKGMTARELLKFIQSLPDDVLDKKMIAVGRWAWGPVEEAKVNDEFQVELYVEVDS